MKTCLVVDDSRVVRMVARKILEELGFAVTEAEDGKIAVEACQKSMPDVVWLDWQMPVMNGIECLHELRKMKGAADAKVVFVTTLNDMNHIVEAMGSGADEYIMKPFDRDIVQSKFAQVGLL